MSQDFSPPTYPVVQFLVARGKSLAIALSAAVLLLSVVAGVVTHALWLLPAGLVAAGVLLVLLLSYVEVLRIIADTLIPKY